MDEIKWKFISHISMENEHGILHSAKYKENLIIKETVTKMNGFKIEKPKTWYYIDGKKGEYDTLNECLESIQ